MGCLTPSADSHMIICMRSNAVNNLQKKRWVLGGVLMLLAFAALACNLPAGGSVTPVASVPTSTDLPSDGTRPRVLIESPSSGSQALNGQPFKVRVHAFDNIGITRVEMREAGRVVVTQPSPDPNPDFVALLG